MLRVAVVYLALLGYNDVRAGNYRRYLGDIFMR